MRTKKASASPFKIILAILVCVPYIGLAYIWYWYNNKAGQIKNATIVVVSKEDMQLSVFDYKGILLFEAPIACGENFGDKKEIGDRKTPEGVFSVSQIQESSHWSHDFNDGNGKIKGAYGPYFIRLETPGHKGIGIHGTHNPNSIGNRETEGCIRLNNDDLLAFEKLVKVGTVVIINPSAEDLKFPTRIKEMQDTLF